MTVANSSPNPHTVDAVPHSKPGGLEHTRSGKHFGSGTSPGQRRGASGKSGMLSFPPEELASLDAVREDAVRRFTRRLAPKLGEKTYGHSEREAEANASGAFGGGVALDVMEGTVENQESIENLAADDDDPGAVNGTSIDDTVKQPTTTQNKAPPVKLTPTAKVGTAALQHEVQRRSREYVQMREAEFWRSVKAQVRAAEEKAKLQKAKVLEEQKKQSRGLGKVKFGDETEVDFVAEQKREQAARQALDRQHNVELLEARLSAWPMSKVLQEVELAFIKLLKERRRAAGLDQDQELFAMAEKVVDGGIDGTGIDVDGDFASSATGAAPTNVAPPLETERTSESLQTKRPPKRTASGKKHKLGGGLHSLGSYSPQENATIKAYKNACVSLKVTPNTVAKNGLISQSGVCDVSGAALGDDACCAISMAVPHSPKCTSLVLSKNAISSEGLRRICVFGLGKLRYDSELAVIDFSKNIEIGSGRVGCQAFTDWLESSANVPTGLHTVNLSGCGISDPDGAAIIHALGLIPGLKTLNLSGNKLGKQSSAALSVFFGKGNCEDVNVSGNCFGLNDGLILGNALNCPSGNTNATASESASNTQTPIRTKSDVSVKSATSQKSTKNLKSENSIKNSSVTCSVKYLNVSNNGFNDDGCVALVEALVKNTSLLSLDLTNTRFGANAADTLKSSLQKNSSVKTITLDRNDVGPDGLSALLKQLDLCRSDGNKEKQLVGISLTDVRTEDASQNAKQQRETRFATEGAAKKKGKKGGAKKGAAKKGAKKAPAPAKDLTVLKSETVCPMASAVHGSFRAFSPTRPEGRHVFDLSDSNQRGIAGGIFELDHESENSQKIVNLTLDGSPVFEDPVVFRWPETLPTRGVLQFDFVQIGEGLRKALSPEVGESPNPKALALDDSAFAATLKDVGCVRLTPLEKRQALEHARRERLFTPTQAASIVNTFDVGGGRVDATSALIPRLGLSSGETQDAGARLVSKEILLAEKAQRETFAPLTANEQTSVFSRFGVAHTRYLPFHKNYPSGRYELDLSLRCDRNIAAQLATESQKDGGDFMNFRDATYFDDDSGLFISSDKTQNVGQSIGPWVFDTGDGKGPAPPPTTGVLSFEYVKKPFDYKDAAGMYTDGAKRLRASEALVIQKKLKKYGKGAQSCGYFSGDVSDVICRYKNEIVFNNRTTTCAFVGSFIDAVVDSEVRVELAVTSRDACVDTTENWMDVIDKLRGDEQSAVCARTETWPSVNIAKGRAQYERSERKALRTAARRDARLAKEKEIADQKAAEAAQAAERKRLREEEKLKKAAEKAALHSKKKKGSSSRASSVAGDTSVAPSVAPSVMDTSETQTQVGDVNDPTEKALEPPAEAIEDVPEGEEEYDGDAPENEDPDADVDAADMNEDDDDDAHDEDIAELSDDTPKQIRTISVEDEIDEEDGLELEVTEAEMQPASMRYVLDCSDSSQAEVFRTVLAAAKTLPVKWKPIRNFRAGGVAKDEFVTAGLIAGIIVKPVNYDTVFDKAKAFCEGLNTVPDVCTVDEVVAKNIAAHLREKKEAEEAAEKLKLEQEKQAKKKGKFGDIDDEEKEDEMDEEKKEPPPPIDYSYKNHIKTGVPFVVEFDFFGLDIFERFNIPFMEKAFYRDGLLDGKAHAFDAERVRCGHVFHLREMGLERGILDEHKEIQEALEGERVEQAEKEKAEKAKAEETGEDGDESDDEAEATVTEAVATDALPAEGAVESLAADIADIQIPESLDGQVVGEEEPKPKPKFQGWKKLQQNKTILRGEGRVVAIATPVFDACDSPWWSPIPGGVARSETALNGLSDLSTTKCAYTTDPKIVHASLADKTTVYKKTWQRFEHKIVRCERDANFYNADSVVTYTDTAVDSDDSQHKLQRHHACPLREIWRVIRQDTHKSNVSLLSQKIEKNEKLVEKAKIAADKVTEKEALIETAKGDLRLEEARLADPVDQNMIKTLEVELGDILAPLEEGLEKAKEVEEKSKVSADLAASENGKLTQKLTHLKQEGPFGAHDTAYPATKVNAVLKKITGGVGFKEELIELCCGLTDECLEDIKNFEVALKGFTENPPAAVAPVQKPGQDAVPLPPPPKPPSRPKDVRSVTWTSFESMFLSTDFKRSVSTETTPKLEDVSDAIAVAVKLEKLAARDKAIARREAAATRARAAAEATAAARKEAGEEAVDADAGADAPDAAAVVEVPQVQLESLESIEAIESVVDPLNTDPPAPITGLPRITPFILGKFNEKRKEAEEKVKQAALEAAAKAAKATKGKKAPGGKKKEVEVPEEIPPPPPTERDAAGKYRGDDLLRAAAGIDPTPPVEVETGVTEEVPTGKKK